MMTNLRNGVARRAISIGMTSALAVGVLALGAPTSPVAGLPAPPEGWSALGEGIGDGRVFQIATASDGSIYVGGTFTAAGGQADTRNIARWTGSAWEALGTGVTDSGPNTPYSGVFTVAVAPGATVDSADGPSGGPGAETVWIGGDFAAVDGSPQSRLARWEVGNDWISTPSVEDTAERWDGVEEIVAVSRDEVYIGGRFTARTSGSPDPALTGLAEYDSGSLVTVGGGLLDAPFGSPRSDAIVNGMVAADDGKILVTGQFLGVGPSGSRTSVNRVAEWDPTTSTWSAVGGADSGPDALVAAVADTPAGIVVGGLFTKVTNSGNNVADTNRLAMWNGTSWVSIGTVDGAVVEELRVIGDYLYVGGEFTSVGGVDANNIARVRLATLATSPVWEPLTDGCENGVNGVVRSVADAGAGAIYVGGGFTSAGDVDAADRIALYSPSSAPCSTRLPAPTNFRMAGVVRDVVDGEGGSRVYYTWDVPTDAGYTRFKVTTRGRLRDNGVYNPNVTHSDLTCETTTNTCSIFFPFRGVDPSMRGRRFQQVIYTLRSFSPLGKVKPTSFGPLYQIPREPPSPPRDVKATNEWNSVKVTWREPADRGSADIVTVYLAQASPGGRVCVVRTDEFPATKADRSCEFRTLKPGQDYTFTVRALTWNGEWSEPSAPSNSTTPQDLRITSSKRSRPSLGLLGGTRVTVDGEAPGYAPKTKLKSFVRIGSGNWRADDTVTVNKAGRFSFEKRFGIQHNRQPISVRFELADRSACGRSTTCGVTEPVTLPAAR